MDRIDTERLLLVPATQALVDAELESVERLAFELGVEVPPDWPPEHHDPNMLAFTREALEPPEAAGWWLHYFVWKDGRVLVGAGGYKGPPRDGEIEVGYTVVPSYQRRGVATEAVAGLIAAGRARGATRVIAHTLPELAPSIGVLDKLGFEPAEPAEPGVLAYAREA